MLIIILCLDGFVVNILGTLFKLLEIYGIDEEMFEGMFEELRPS
jgi:hypothetical protein